MNTLIERFLDHVSLERGLSGATREAYGRDLTSFDGWIGRRGVTTFNAVDRDLIIEYLLAERERGLSVNSVSRRLVTIKVFFRYLQLEGMLDTNVTDVMDSPRLWKVLPGVLALREVERLLAAPVGDDRYRIRDRAILEVMYACGLRVSELCDLTLDDLHLDECYLRCTGKGRKVRVVPFGAMAVDRIEQYLRESRPEFAGADAPRHVFLTYRGRPFSRKGIWLLIKAYTRSAGIQKNVSPHTLRHSFASHLLANGAPLRVIQEMLGHADIVTTQVYTHVDQSRLRSVHHKFHPRA